MGQDRATLETPAQATSRWPWLPRIHTFDSLAGKDFRLLWAGSFFDNVAIWLQLLSLGWLVLDLTGSVVLSGTVAGLRGLPTLVIGPWAGVVADRLDRRKLVIFFQAILAVFAAIFAVTVAIGAVEWWHAFVYAAVTSVCFAFIMPIRQALVANTAPPGNLGNAYALSAMTITVNRLIGGMLGGLLITTVGIKWNFFVESGAYVLTALLLIPMRTPYAEKPTAGRTSVLRNLADGMRYIWTENRIILHLMILSMVLTWVFLPIPALLPAYASKVLNSEANVGGYLLAAQGVGGITATVGIATLGFVFGKGRLGLLALITGSTAVLVLAQSQWVALSLCMLVVFGISQSCFIVSNNTLLQSLVPDTLRGRITSLYMLEHGLGPVAIFVIALFMDKYSVAGALTVVGAVAVGLSLIFLFVFQRVRRLE